MLNTQSVRAVSGCDSHETLPGGRVERSDNTDQIFPCLPACPGTLASADGGGGFGHWAHLYSLTLCTEMVATPLSGSDVMAMRNEGDESQTQLASLASILLSGRCVRVCVRGGGPLNVALH